MSLGFTKNFMVEKQYKSNKQSETVTDLFHGMKGGEVPYAEKVSDQGISFHQMHMMYITNPWIRACVDKIIERFINIEPIIKPVDTDIVSGKLSDETKRNIEKVNEFLAIPNSNYESLVEIRKKWARDVLKYDAAAIEITKGIDIKGRQRIAEIYNTPGNTIKLNVDKRGVLDKKEAYVQIDRAMRKVTSWSPDQMMYFMNNPQSEKIYGLSSLETLVQTVTAELYASQYNLDFFYNNATPRFAVLMEGLGIGQGSSALKRVRQWWDNELQGKPHRPIIMGTEQGKVQLQKVGLTNEEMQFQQYSAYLLVKIMSVFKVQPVVLGIVGMSNVGSGGGATSNVEEQVRQFKLDAIQPLLKLFWHKINQRIIFNSNVLNMKDVYVDYDLDLVDKDSQADWHDKYLQDGVITINEIRTRALGLRPVPWGNVPYLQNNLVPFGANSNNQTQAVPGNQAQADAAAQENGTGSRSDIAAITAQTSRGDLEKYISKNTNTPIGWERMPVSKRLDLIEQLIKEREKFLSKVYMNVPKIKDNKNESESQKD